MLKQKHATTALLLITAIVASYFIFFKQPEYMKIRELTEMDYNNIQLAKLPQDQLFTYEQAEALKEKAFYEGFPTIKDEQAMLELTKHAYQWDKNAMIAYAQIVRDFRTRPSDSDAVTLADFLKKYSYELVDVQGKPLETPALFQLEYNDFLKVLANKGYVQPAILIARFTPHSLGDEKLRQEGIHSYRLLVNAGQKYYIALANTILFEARGGVKDPYGLDIETLDNHLITNVTDEQINEAIECFKLTAKHGNQYAMFRLAEVYYYGIGAKHDYKLAFAWSQLSNMAYKYYIDNPKEDTNNIQDSYRANISKANSSLNSQIKQHLNGEQINEAEKLAEELKQTIVTWDYEKWSNDVVIPIQP